MISGKMVNWINRVRERGDENGRGDEKEVILFEALFEFEICSLGTFVRRKKSLADLLVRKIWQRLVRDLVARKRN